MGVNPVPDNILSHRDGSQTPFILYKTPIPTVIWAKAGIQPSYRIHFHPLTWPLLAIVILSEAKNLVIVTPGAYKMRNRTSQVCVGYAR